MQRLGRLPLLVLLIGIAGAAMLVPAGYAAATGWKAISGYFFFSALLMLVLTLLLGIATSGRVRPPPGGNGLPALSTMLAVFGILPVALGVPLAMALPDTGLFNAWWEMVSCLTTTGATLYAADMLAPPLHLWRSLVGWLGDSSSWSRRLPSSPPSRSAGSRSCPRPMAGTSVSSPCPTAPMAAPRRPGNCSIPRAATA